MSYRIITIDGPAGAGKTTVSRTLARRLGCIYVDTGALYRGVAYEIREQQIDWENDQALETFLKRLDLAFVREGDNLVLTSAGKDITPYIRTQEISMLASATSAKPAVREALLGIQKQIALTCDAVYEGRDMGTAVFPEAPFKFFLSADLEIRARRRYEESSGSDRDMERLKTQMAKRDSDDAGRETSPLKPAADAVHVDSTHMTIKEVVEEMLSYIEKQG